MTLLYAGLDVSDKKTHICIVDDEGALHWEGAAPTDPAALSRALAKRAPDVSKVVLETGPLSAFLYHGLTARDAPVSCICARHAKGVLSTRINKTDPNDAEGLAQLARTGWYKQIHIKDQTTHLDRALLRVRHQLVKTKVDLVNQLRGLLKLFGLRLGTVTTPGMRTKRLVVLFGEEPRLREILSPLHAALCAVEAQLAALDKDLKKKTAMDPVCRRLMTAPGVGPVTALTFKASIEDPARFVKSEDVGAYAGLTPRRFQSGDMDVSGSISRRGDQLLRRALYEAANALLGRVKKTCALKTWGEHLAEHKGAKRARVAVARKLAILLHRMWTTQQDFDWQRV